ncbi:MAG: hypothetical protein ACMXYE_05190 [Candidatus Woesearchaeota archaeon]
MAKCDICREKVGETFLNKVLGTYIRDAHGKRRLVCSDCQHKLQTREKILKHFS